MGCGKRKHTFLINENMQTDENTKTQKSQKIIQERKRKRKNENDIKNKMVSFQSNYIDNVVFHRNIQSNHGMVSLTSEYIQHLKESYTERSYIGNPEYMCKYCNSIFWFSERN
jgi:hypothetical protein